MDIKIISNLVDYGVVGVLGVMAFLTLFFYIERLLFLKSVDISKYNQKEALEIDLTKNITIISTFAANAPYIGLLGTVLGIIITFYTMGISGEIDLKNIMSSLALALKATAMGLFVAIPAILFYNHLVRKIEVLLSTWDMEKKGAN